MHVSLEDSPKAARTMASGGTNTIHFIHVYALPAGSKATYAQLVANIQPQKEDMHRVRLTEGGNIINYLEPIIPPTSEITTTKLLLHSVISTPITKLITSDIEDF